MYFDEKFFEEEERDGFYISSMVKRVWAVQLDVLEVISRICRKYNIRWFADSGTLLGAVRHQGYIPWDDDLDIAMLRPDYERFCKVARKEIPKGWNLFNGRKDEGAFEAILRLNNSTQITTSAEFLKQNHGCPYMIGVDIFSIDKLPDDPEEEETFRLLVSSAYHAFAQVCKDAKFDDCDEDVRDEISQVEEFCGINLDHSMPIKSQLYELADNLAAAYYDADTDMAACILYYCNNPRRKFPIDSYNKTERCQFEMTSLPIPGGYENVLKAYYGEDYMIPKMIRAEHNYPYFRGQINELKAEFEKLNVQFPKEFDV